MDAKTVMYGNHIIHLFRPESPSHLNRRTTVGIGRYDDLVTIVEYLIKVVGALVGAD